MIKVNGFAVEKQFFPDGTPRIQLETSRQESCIEWLYEPNEEMLLLYITRHLKEQCGAKRLELVMPYIPNARMDRVKHKSEVFTLKYFCAFINGLEFDRVVVRDAHSSVALALLDRVEQEDIQPVVQQLAQRLLGKNDIVFYPDEGSCKRYSDMIRFPCAFGIKTRDWATGKILGLEVQGTVPDGPFNALIVDDISSYGGTFLHAAKKLKELGAQKIYLYVTHCENTILAGELIGSGLLEKIYTTQSIYTKGHPLIEVIGENDNG